MKKKLTAYALIAAMAVTGLAGCGSAPKENQGTAGTTGTVTQETGASGQESSEPVTETETLEKWPEKVTLTWYLRGNEDEYYQHLWDDMESLKAIEEATNIEIKFEVATNDDSYIPMMTSGEYPDIITAKNMERYPGRLAAMYKDGISVKLDELIEEYMPNFKKILTDYPQIAKDLKLDSGEYTFFSQLFDVNREEDREAKSAYGLGIRKDWLDNLGLEIPTDMAEWYTVLKAFKTQDPNGNGQADEEPICMASSGWKYFLGAYGISTDPTIGPDNKVIYGPATGQYKQFLEEMHKWYTEELVYNWFENRSLQDREERVTNNLAGAWKADAPHFDENDSYLSKLKEKVPDAEFAAVPWPKTADGVQYCYSDIASFSRDTTIITSKCKNPEAAAFLIDYMYSEEGSALLTWGVEGKSYEVVNGERKLLPEMSEEFEYYGVSVPNMYAYADCNIVNFPSFGQFSDYVLSSKSDGYIDACGVWSQGEIFKLPYPVQLSPEQQDKVNSATEGMSGYISAEMYNFITGEEPLTNFDAYVDQLELMGLSTLIEVWQECYDAYLAR